MNKKEKAINALKTAGFNTDNDKIEVYAQHPGAWGPWYHTSVYRITDNGTLHFVSRGLHNIGKDIKGFRGIAEARAIIKNK